MDAHTTMLFNLSQGNPGALRAVMELMKPENIVHSLVIISKLEECPSIKGTNLYVLVNDLCDWNYEKVAKLCEICPNDILEDACSRQDYSGRELVKPYIQ